MTRIDDYLARNKAVADVLFPLLEHPAPVFFDVDERLLDEILPAVRWLAKPRLFRPAFTWFKDETADWGESGSADAPPALGLLAVCAYAARGSRSGEHYAERLSTLLKIRGVRLVEPYLRVEEELWRSLWIWSTRNSDMRGLAPTFVVGTDTAWGRARAHTLLSADQREALHGFFHAHDLLPGTQIFPPLLSAPFEQWLASDGAVTRGLEMLWSDDDARPHLLQLIADILETWDGRLPEPAEPRLRLTLDFFGSRDAIELGLMLQTPHTHSRYVRAEVGGEERSVPLAIRRPGAVVAPPQYRTFADEELLIDPIALELEDGEVVGREPRTVLQFREDPVSGAWLETESVRTGEAVKILAAQGAPTEPILAELAEGSRRVRTAEELRGLPEGWVLIDGIAQTDGGEVTIEFAGGLRIPMPLDVPPHFHADFPLGITASASGEAFTLKVHRDPRGDAVPVGEPRVSDGQPVHVDFTDQMPGLYRVTFRSEHRELSREFWLVSAGTQTEGRWGPGAITLDARDPLFALNRGRLTDEHEEWWSITGLPNGAPEDYSPLEARGQDLPGDIWWRAAKPAGGPRVGSGVGSAIDWDLLWSILVMVEGGSNRLMRSILNQFDPSERFFNEAVRKFESLGHIEVLRDLDTGEIARWAMNPTVVLDMGSVRRFVGHWVPEHFHQLEAGGVEIIREAVDNGPTLITTPASIEELEQAAPGNTYFRDPVRALAALLPPLGEAIENVPHQVLPDDLGWERYDPQSNAWESVTAVVQPGAYRTGGYRRLYFLVDEDGVRGQRGRMFDPHTAKHGGALMEFTPRPLLAYAKDEELLVPLRTLLPGMYGRVATLSSGRPRRKHEVGEGTGFAYGKVEAETAGRLAHLLARSHE